MSSSAREREEGEGDGEGAGPRHLSAAEAAALDRELFSSYRYSVEQLMELAGLSVATAAARAFPAAARVLVVCGPGNNGGDGLVAARHLAQFGLRRVAAVLARAEARPPLPALREQCARGGVATPARLPSAEEARRDYDLLVDALFGFGFVPPVRDEFRPALDLMLDAGLPVCSVDVPSGWDVDAAEAEPEEEARQLRPAALVSLSAPKRCAARLARLAGAQHWLGGRFVPPALAAAYRLRLPRFPAQEQVVRLL